jgi:hypothetical protein
MHRDVESRPDPLRQLPPRHGRLGDPRGSHKRHHLGRQFVPAVRAPLARQQAGQARAAKGPLGLIKRRAGQTKGRRGAPDRLLIDLHLAQHLVLDLDEIVRIEELAVAEERMSDRPGAGIERAALAQHSALGSLAPLGHDR